MADVVGDTVPDKLPVGVADIVGETVPDVQVGVADVVGETVLVGGLLEGAVVGIVRVLKVLGLLTLGRLVGSRLGLADVVGLAGVVGDTVPEGVLEGTVIGTVTVLKLLGLLTLGRLVGSSVGITELVGDTVPGEV